RAEHHDRPRDCKRTESFAQQSGSQNHAEHRDQIKRQRSQSYIKELKYIEEQQHRNAIHKDSQERESHPRFQIERREGAEGKWLDPDEQRNAGEGCEKKVVDENFTFLKML